jgi:hypothetical protein
MQKHALLEAVTAGIRAKTVTRNEVMDAVAEGMDASSPNRSLKLSEILYYIGGGIVFLGIAILVSQNWSDFSPLTRILVTLGSGIAAYFAGLTFIRDGRTERVGQAFFSIAALLLPLGLFVTFDQAGYGTEQASTNTLVSGLLSGMFLASFFALKKDVFLLFAILFSTWLFFALTSWMVGSAGWFYDVWWRFYAYRFVAVGLSYVLLGYHFQRTGREGFTGFLYGFGSLGILSGALWLGGWSPEASILWEALFPGVVLGMMFLSVHLRAKSFLVFGAMFLMIYILKITAEYFQENLGWPLALVIAGLALIAIGYGAVSFNNRYLKKA